MEIRVGGDSFQINKEVIKQAEITKKAVGGHTYIHLTALGESTPTEVKVNDLMKMLNKEKGVFTTSKNKEINEIKAELKSRSGVLEKSDVRIKQSFSSIIDAKNIYNINKSSKELHKNDQEISNLLDRLQNNQEKLSGKVDLLKQLNKLTSSQSKLLSGIDDSKMDMKLSNFNRMSENLGSIHGLAKNFEEFKSTLSELGKKVENELDEEMEKNEQEYHNGMSNEEAISNYSSRIELCELKKTFSTGAELNVLNNDIKDLKDRIDELKEEIKNSESSSSRVEEFNSLVDDFNSLTDRFDEIKNDKDIPLTEKQSLLGEIRDKYSELNSKNRDLSHSGIDVKGWEKARSNYQIAINTALFEKTQGFEKTQAPPPDQSI